MAGVGGYQAPANPAASSGPGAYSQRTDGGPGTTPVQAAQYLKSQAYGDGKQINADQRAAPLAGNPVQPDPTASVTPPTDPTAGVVPFNSPTQNPNEPVTSGVDGGAGAGPEVMNLPTPASSLSAGDYQKLATLVGLLGMAADLPDASQATRTQYRQARAFLPNPPTTTTGA